MPTHLAPKTAADATRPTVFASWAWSRHQRRFVYPIALLLLLLLLALTDLLFLRVQHSPRRLLPSAPLEQAGSPNDVTYLVKSQMMASLSAHVSPSQLQEPHVTAEATSSEQPTFPHVSAAAAAATYTAATAAEPSFSSAGMGEPSTAALRRVTNSNGKKLVTLFWNTFWGDSFEGCLKSGPPPSARCSRLCELAYDRRRLLDADVVIFHAPELRHQRLPDVRKADQLWVLFTLEAPRHGYVSSVHDGVFNLTMTYRGDSDIEAGYGHAEALVVATARTDNCSSPATLPLSSSVADILNFAKRKPYAYWVVSNCAGPRMAYVQELARHIRVDVFGKCGPVNARPCNSSTSASPEQNCVEELGATYAFHLSFENSLCTDYITEKLWRVLASPGGAIPVVIGASPNRYAQVAPPGSYVHAENFGSPRDLAAHLTRVAASHDLFASYHQWRERYRVHVGWYNEFSSGVCRLCESVYDGAWRPSRPAKPDLSGWFSSGCNGKWPGVP